MVYEPYRQALWRLTNHRFDPAAHLRKTAQVLGLSPKARARLEWFLWKKANPRATIATLSRRFGITPKTYYQWAKRYDPANLRTLEELSKSPRQKRRKEYTPVQYERVDQEEDYGAAS
jgi:hypothetical protein